MLQLKTAIPLTVMAACVWLTAFPSERAFGQTAKTAPAAKTYSGPRLPERNLLVELRQVEDSAGQGQVYSTQPASPLLAPQQVQVRNGERALLQMGQNMPIRFIQAVAGEQSGNRGGVAYGMVWMQAGQSLVLTPRWPGAKQPVRVDIDLQASGVQEPTGSAELPTQTRSQLATSLNVPLGQWVTVAATGSAPAKGSYSSEAANEVPRLVQIRISAP